MIEFRQLFEVELESVSSGSFYLDALEAIEAHSNEVISRVFDWRRSLNVKLEKSKLNQKLTETTPLSGWKNRICHSVLNDRSFMF